MTITPINLGTPWTLCFARDGTEDFGIICLADGSELVSSQHCRTCWLPESEEDELPQLVRQLRLMVAAPKLLDALRYLLSQTVDMDLKHGITLTEGEEDARAQAITAITEAMSEEVL